MKGLGFLICLIISLKVYSQDCHAPVINYHPKEIIGNYLVYEFMPKNSKDSTLLILAVYDSVERTQTKTMYREVYTMAGYYKDPGIHKMHLDSNGNVLCRKIYAEGKTYNGKYKYVGLDECTYDNLGNILSESTFGTTNIPATFAYTDSTFEQAIKNNYMHRASPDCISRYRYEYRRIAAIENYKNGALLFKNELNYASVDLIQTKAYKPDGTMLSTVEFGYSPKGFTQTLYYYSGQGAAAKKEEDSYYWEYTKESGRIVEIEYGKNEIMIDKNKYTFDPTGRIISIKFYDKKGLVCTHKYFYR